MKSGSNSNRFYEKLAPVYDLKVDWVGRHGKEQKLFSYLLETLKPTSVLDIGCGDGGHAPVYSAAGVAYVGIDLSNAMIEKARTKHQEMPGVIFDTGEMSRLPAKFTQAFDQVVLLGNTLPHLLTERSLAKTVAGLSRALRVGGHLIIQTVNPGPLKKKQAHFLPAKMSGETFFAPFYINRGPHWDFLMPIYRVGGPGSVLLSAEFTRLRFWSKAEIVVAAAIQKLKLVAAFGNASLEPYKQPTSENMILVFRKK